MSRFEFCHLNDTITRNEAMQTAFKMAWANPDRSVFHQGPYNDDALAHNEALLLAQEVAAEQAAFQMASSSQCQDQQEVAQNKALLLAHEIAAEQAAFQMACSSQYQDQQEEDYNESDYYGQGYYDEAQISSYYGQEYYNTIQFPDDADYFDYDSFPLPIHTPDGTIVDPLSHWQETSLDCNAMTYGLYSAPRTTHGMDMVDYVFPYYDMAHTDNEFDTMTAFQVDRHAATLPHEATAQPAKDATDYMTNEATTHQTKEATAHPAEVITTNQAQATTIPPFKEGTPAAIHPQVMATNVTDTVTGPTTIYQVEEVTSQPDVQPITSHTIDATSPPDVQPITGQTNDVTSQHPITNQENDATSQQKTETMPTPSQFFSKPRGIYPRHNGYVPGNGSRPLFPVLLSKTVEIYLDKSHKVQFCQYIVAKGVRLPLEVKNWQFFSGKLRISYLSLYAHIWTYSLNKISFSVNFLYFFS